MNTSERSFAYAQRQYDLQEEPEYRDEDEQTARELDEADRRLDIEKGDRV